jgi:uncharacterized protein (UPF0276 family)
MPSTVLVGVSADSRIPPDQYETADYLEMKRISWQEAGKWKSAWAKPVYFHLQYAPDGHYMLPAAEDLGVFRSEFSQARDILKPPVVSFHFSPGSRDVRIIDDLYLQADGPVLQPAELAANLETNLAMLRSVFAGSSLLIENMEYIPETLSRGACSLVAEPSFFSEKTTGWHRNGLIDGTVLDVAHALITAGNHPAYGGSAGRSGSPAGPEELHEHYEQYVEDMPLHLVREIHISGIGRMGDTWVDTHRPVGETELKALAILLDKLRPGLQVSVTIEQNTNLPGQLHAVRNVADFRTNVQ